MKINGLLIDCSRLIERHDYYPSLIEFMAEWGMNTLILHFTDDHGCSISLPGFEHIAAPRAFSAEEIRQMVHFAQKRGIEIIPELETFGHTRYLTDHPKYKHLAAGKNSRNLTFNAINPIHNETFELMRKLIEATSQLFPSEYVHIGCDEVDLDAFCKANNLPDKSPIWAEYVNRIIEFAHENGKTPMMWADHIVSDSEIEKLLNKEVIALHWNYEEDPNIESIQKLQLAGFKGVMGCPSIACYKHRFLPGKSALSNTLEMAKGVSQFNANGLITTVWCPYRYVQGALYYGIAYAAAVTNSGGNITIESFNREFAKKVFGTDLTDSLANFLDKWVELQIDHGISLQLVKRKPEFDPLQIERLSAVNRLGKDALDLAEKYQPRTNFHIWEDMVLAAKCAWICSERVVLSQHSGAKPDRLKAYSERLKEIEKEILDSWDRGRYPDDPQKLSPRFPNEKAEYAIALLNYLPKTIRPKQCG